MSSSQFNAIPLAYNTPPFPSLYWPFDTDGTKAKYLYRLSDIWKFTLYWTLITISLAHLVVAVWAILMQFVSAKEKARLLKERYSYGRSHNKSTRSRNRSRSKSKSKSTLKSEKASKGNATKINSATTDSSSPPIDQDPIYQVTSSKKGNSTSGDSINRIPTTTTHTTNNINKHQNYTRAPSRAPPTRNSDPDLDSDSDSDSDTHNPSKTTAHKNRQLIGSSPYKSTLQYSAIILTIYLVVGAIEAFIAGSVVGLVLGAIYNSGFFRMSVWTPLFWGIINMLVLILSSYRISGGM